MANSTSISKNKEYYNSGLVTLDKKNKGSNSRKIGKDASKFDDAMYKPERNDLTQGFDGDEPAHGFEKDIFTLNANVSKSFGSTKKIGSGLAALSNIPPSNSELKEDYDNVEKALTNFINSIKKDMKNQQNGLKNQSLAENFGNAVAGRFVDAYDGAVDSAKNTYELIKDVVGEVIEGDLSDLKDQFDNAYKSLGEKGKFVQNAIGITQFILKDPNLKKLVMDGVKEIVGDIDQNQVAVIIGGLVGDMLLSAATSGLGSAGSKIEAAQKLFKSLDGLVEALNKRGLPGLDGKSSKVVEKSNTDDGSNQKISNDISNLNRKSFKNPVEAYKFIRELDGEIGIIQKLKLNLSKNEIGKIKSEIREWFPDDEYPINYESIDKKLNESFDKIFSQEDISEIKEYLFNNPKFTPKSGLSPDIEGMYYNNVESWLRLDSGKGNDADLILLKHEFLEMKLKTEFGMEALGKEAGMSSDDIHFDCHNCAEKNFNYVGAMEGIKNND